MLSTIFSNTYCFFFQTETIRYKPWDLLSVWLCFMNSIAVVKKSIIDIIYRAVLGLIKCTTLLPRWDSKSALQTEPTRSPGEARKFQTEQIPVAKLKGLHLHRPARPHIP